MQVIDRNFKPVKGLYAAGVATSGWLAHSYGFPGSEMGHAMYSGYKAGEAAAEESARV